MPLFCGTLVFIDNMHYFQTISSVREINTRYKNYFQYLQSDFLLYREVQPTLLLRFL